MGWCKRFVHSMWRHLPVWWAIDIWIDLDEHCMQHSRCDRRSPLWHRRCPSQAAHFSASTSMPNCRAPFRRYLVAFSLPAMNSRWFSLLMHNLFANCYLPWNFQTKWTTNIWTNLYCFSFFFFFSVRVRLEFFISINLIKCRITIANCAKCLCLNICEWHCPPASRLQHIVLLLSSF